MSIDIVRGASRKPAASRELDKFMSTRTELSGQLFIGYPIISTPEGRYLIDALLVTPDRGIVVFDLIEGPDASDYGPRQDDLANKLEARLKTHRELMKGRKLCIEIHTISFAPGVHDPSSQVQDDYPLVNTSSLLQELEKFTWEGSDEEVYKKTLSAIESISTIRKSGTKRAVKRDGSRGSKLGPVNTTAMH